MRDLVGLVGYFGHQEGIFRLVTSFDLLILDVEIQAYIIKYPLRLFFFFKDSVFCDKFTGRYISS
jgi:hypothetical protein